MQKEKMICAGRRWALACFKVSSNPLDLHAPALDPTTRCSLVGDMSLLGLRRSRSLQPAAAFIQLLARISHLLSKSANLEDGLELLAALCGQVVTPERLYFP